jgi:hypothetical protein
MNKFGRKFITAIIAPGAIAWSAYAWAQQPLKKRTGVR